MPPLLAVLTHIRKIPDILWDMEVNPCPFLFLNSVPRLLVIFR